MSIQMATIAVGDVYGNLAALSDVLDQIRDAVGDGDCVVFLGDCIDWGGQSESTRFQREC